jgi:hypothetical protein
MLRSLVVLLVVLAAAPKAADACAVGSPCLKYRKPDIYPRVIRQQPSEYVRTSGGTFRSFTRSRVVSFLTGAQWNPNTLGMPVPAGVKVIKAVPIRFVDAAHAVRTNRTDLRIVLVRRIEYKDGVTMIEVDNEIWALAKCENRNRMCLTQRNDLSFTPPEAETTQFAEPPP